MGGKSKTQTTTSTTGAQPWVEEQLKFGNQQARALYDQGMPEFFPGQTYVDFDPATTQALDLTAQRALGGNAGVQAAQGMLTNTAAGGYLNANPYLDGIIDSTNRDTTRDFFSAINQVRGSAAGAGRYGSGAAIEGEQRTMDNFARTLADSGNRLRGAEYGAERGRMMQAAGMAPQFAAQDYVDLAALQGVGSARENQQGLVLQDQMQRYNYNQNADAMALDQFLTRIGQISPLAGNVGTQTTPVQRSNPLGQIAGLALQAGMAYGTGGASLAAGPMFSGMMNSSQPMSAAQSAANGIRWY
jgi:hypothetical protein